MYDKIIKFGLVMPNKKIKGLTEITHKNKAKVMEEINKFLSHPVMRLEGFDSESNPIYEYYIGSCIPHPLRGLNRPGFKSALLSIKTKYRDFHYEDIMEGYKYIILEDKLIIKRNFDKFTGQIVFDNYKYTQFVIADGDDDKILDMKVSEILKSINREIYEFNLHIMNFGYGWDEYKCKFLNTVKDKMLDAIKEALYNQPDNEEANVTVFIGECSINLIVYCKGALNPNNDMKDFFTFRI